MGKTIVYKAKDGYRWRAKKNGKIVAESGEGFQRKTYAKKSAEKFGPAGFKVVVEE